MCNFTHSVEFVLRYGNLRCFCREATFFANLRCFVVRQILSKIYALLRGKFSWPKMRLWKKMTNKRYVRFSEDGLGEVTEEIVSSRPRYLCRYAIRLQHCLQVLSSPSFNKKKHFGPKMGILSPQERVSALLHGRGTKIFCLCQGLVIPVRLDNDCIFK